MVQRVYGTADGIELSFTRTDAGRWEAAVPADADGEYVVELYAESDNGNTSYMATVLFAVDLSTLRASLTWLDFGAQADMTVIGAIASLMPIEAEAHSEDVRVSVCMTKYGLEVLDGAD